MTLRISVAAAVVGAALVFAVPAWGTAGTSDAFERTVLAPQPSLSPGSQPLSTDAIERAVLARERSSRAGLATGRADALERALAAEKRSSGLSGIYRDAVERLAVQSAVPRIVLAYSDAFERAIVARGGIGSGPVGDHHDRVQFGPTTPVSVPVTGSGRPIEWPQIGIGFGLGILLGLGLLLAGRLARIRPLAH